MTGTFKFADLIEQNVFYVPTFELECGAVLRDAPVAYKTWGTLNETKDNVMVICHAFTGSADVEDWWGPLMGPGKAFDPSRYFIFCANVLGSPYGSASPVTIDPETGRPYGPDFPLTTIRDDVRIHKLVLDHLGVYSIAVCIGGSMGGMAVLEWPLCFPGFVKHVVALATSARHSAWCISWGEAQRQSIYSDPAFQGGYYETQPAQGLGAARMAALLTYRSRDSFEARFGRRAQRSGKGTSGSTGVPTPPRSPRTTAPNSPATEVPPTLAVKVPVPTNLSTTASSVPSSPVLLDTTALPARGASPPRLFSAQSYLRYQGDKFISRFDANCYVHITRKLDTHDLGRAHSPPRPRTPDPNSITSAFSSEDEFVDEYEDDAARDRALVSALEQLPPRALIMGVQSDGLFTINEQRFIAAHAPGAKMVVIPSPEGHDGFLLEFELINAHILDFLRREFPVYYAPGTGCDLSVEGFGIKKTSMFGEAEVDITRW